MKSNRLRHVLLMPLFLAILPIAAAQTPPQPSAAMQEANTLFQAKKWPEAAKAYEAITKAEPDNGRAWLRLGVSLHQSAKYDRRSQSSDELELSGKGTGPLSIRYIPQLAGAHMTKVTFDGAPISAPGRRADRARAEDGRPFAAPRRSGMTKPGTKPAGAIFATFIQGIGLP